VPENFSAMSAGPILVCFAVRDEAKHFEAPAGPDCTVVVSGIGKASAERTARNAIASFSPQLVLTCGYASGACLRLPF
jgi:nucleoside phosphorylase